MSGRRALSAGFPAAGGIAARNVAEPTHGHGKGKGCRQCVMAVATGGSFLDSPINSDAIVAFALLE